MLFSNGKHGKFFLKGEVVAFEKVTVPAGTFDAYKINMVLDASGTDEDVNIGNTVVLTEFTCKGSICLNHK